MGFIDIVLGAILVFGLIRGLRNGLVIELASMVSFFIGIFIAVKCSSVFGTSKTAKVFAFVVILALVMIGIHFLAKILSKFANQLFLGWLNKLGGAFFAVLKTTLYLGVILSLFQKININNLLISKATQEKSIFYKPVMKTSDVMLPVLTNWFKDLKSSV
ncbi:CvpA family protein [Flavobacterium aciduliphilum]|uniref:Membrane protein required for colicin V production n=1 Tax=Flavobacterium aciduliphilum TaxID=1101402 RepID=A0A328YDW3_9FLAO|nr:CvpA family protein [Flavobacterium aciduliphilum]RAR71323.1 membrane protein required for colicin V production [Flavobacterium aciduliphilum]